MKMPHALKQRPSQRPPGELDFLSANGENPFGGGMQSLLAGKRALVTGGDSALGRAVALACAEEGADVALAFAHEDKTAGQIRTDIQALGRRCVLLAGRMDDPGFCRQVAAHALKELEGLDILINNFAHDPAAERHGQVPPPAFHTDVFSMFYVTRAVIPHLGPGSAIINTATLAAGSGFSRLSGLPPAGEAIAAYTRSLARGLMGKKIRVNAVAFDPTARRLESTTTAPASLRRLVARCYVFLASDDATELTGQVLCPEADRINLNFQFP